MGSIVLTSLGLEFIVKPEGSDPFGWMCLVQMFCGHSNHQSTKSINYI